MTKYLVSDLVGKPVAGVRAIVTKERCCAGAPLIRELVSVTRTAKKHKGETQYWLRVNWVPTRERIPGCVHGVDTIDCGFSGMEESYARAEQWSIGLPDEYPYDPVCQCGETLADHEKYPAGSYNHSFVEMKPEPRP